MPNYFYKPNKDPFYILSFTSYNDSMSYIYTGYRGGDLFKS